MIPKIASSPINYIVILLTVLILVTNVYGMSRLEMYFDVKWLISMEHIAYSLYQMQEAAFPDTNVVQFYTFEADF